MSQQLSSDNLNSSSASLSSHNNITDSKFSSPIYAFYECDFSLNKFICKKCNENVNRNKGTTNQLINHYIRHHNYSREELNLTINPITKGDKYKQKKVQLQNSIIQWMGRFRIPLYSIRSPLFRDIALQLNSDYMNLEIMGSSLENWIESKFSHFQTLLNKSLSEFPSYISIHSLSRSDPYNSLCKCHFIDENWNYQEFVIGFDTCSIKLSYDTVNHPFMMIQAPNLWIPHLPFFDSIISQQLLMLFISLPGWLLTDQTPSLFYQTSKRLRIWFRENTHKFNTSVPWFNVIRMNELLTSTILTIKQLNEQFESLFYLYKACSEIDCPSQFTSTEWNNVLYYYHILRLVFKLNQSVHNMSRPIGLSVLVFSIQHIVDSIDGRIPIFPDLMSSSIPKPIQSFLEAIRIWIHRNGWKELDSLSQSSVLLDPRTRGLAFKIFPTDTILEYKQALNESFKTFNPLLFFKDSFISPKVQIQYTNELKDQYDSIERKLNALNPFKISNPEQKLIVDEELQSLDLFEQNKSSRRVTVYNATESERFLKDKTSIAKESNAFEWWKNNADDYPSLSLMARCMMSIAIPTLLYHETNELCQNSELKNSISTDLNLDEQLWFLYKNGFSIISK
jgi:hypothetical protein